MADRAAVRRAVARMLEASGLDELFAAAGADAPVLRAVLADLARGRAGRWYGTGARIARRRGFTAAYAVDRAAMLWSALETRRRDDLYRALGVPPLAPPDALAARWQEVVRTAHPRGGGDAGRFRAARVAWETLRDPVRRAEYERWWVRALGPFADVQPWNTSAGGRSGSPPAMPGVASAAAVSASNASMSTSGRVPAGAPARRARPSRSSVRAPRGLPCAR
jgi:hypothetical protein